MARKTVRGRTVTMRYLQTITSRGREFHYYRRAGRRVPLGSGVPADHPEIVAAWCAAHAAHERREDDIPGRGTFGQVVEVYLASAAFAGLAAETRKNRAAVLRRYLRTEAHRPMSTLTREAIEAALAQRTPHAGLTDLKALRAALAYARTIGLIPADPSEGIRIKLPRSEGFHTATPDEIAAYAARWDRGTQARLVFDLALLTGQRRGDLVRMGRQMERGGVLEVRQQKTGALALIPITSELAAALEPFRDRMVYILSDYGRPRTAAGLGTAFRKWSAAVPDPGFPGSLHSLRKAFCCYHAERGLSPHQIAAMSGHLTLGEVESYTRAADRRRMVQAIREG